MNVPEETAATTEAPATPEPAGLSRMRMLKAVAVQADLFRDNAQELGHIACEAFGDDRRRQMKGLERVANGALKVSDVLDYVKRQTGRAKKNEGWKRGRLGEQLLEKVGKDMAGRRCDAVCAELKLQDSLLKLEVRLLLIREFVRQVVIHYEYEVGGR